MPAQAVMLVVIAPGPISLGTGIPVTATKNAKALLCVTRSEQCHSDDATGNGWCGTGKPRKRVTQTLVGAFCHGN